MAAAARSTMGSTARWIAACRSRWRPMAAAPIAALRAHRCPGLKIAPASPDRPPRPVKAFLGIELAIRGRLHGPSWPVTGTRQPPAYAGG